MAQLHPLQKYAAVDYNGLVNDSHFYSMYQQKPELISKMIKQIYSQDMAGEIRAFVERFPVKEVEQENGFYEWMLQGDWDKNISLTDAETMSGATVSAGTFPGIVGRNGEEFYLIFSEPLFERTNVLKGETDDYHFLVKEVEDVAGGRIKCRVELVTDNAQLGVPSDELEVGRRFSKFYGLAPSTLSYEGSKPYFTSPYRMQNRPSTMRMEYEVPGNVINKGKNEPLEFGFHYKGKDQSVWINFQDMVAHHQCEEMFARMLMYGKKNWTNDHQYLNKDENTRYSIESGSGFFEQIDPSNRHYYNDYDLDWHMEILLDMGIGKIGRGQRHIHIMTGEWGAIEISRQIDQKSSSKVTIVSDKFLTGNTGAGNIGGKNTKSYMEPQWNEYHWYNGIKLTVEIVDFLDSDVYFPLEHPDGKGIAESHRMIAMNYGGEAGVYRVKPKGVPDYNWGYIPGMRDPFSAGGKGKPKMIVSPKDGYEVHFQKWGGLMVEDPTKIVDLQLNVER